MRIYQLLHNLVNDNVPIDDATKTDLQTEALTRYNAQKAKMYEYQKSLEATQKIRQEAIEKNIQIEGQNKEIEAENQKNRTQKPLLEFHPVPPLPVKPFVVSIFEVLENWAVRYAFAILYIFIHPRVKAYIQDPLGRKRRKDDDFDDFDDYEDDDDDDDFEDPRRKRHRRS